MGRVVFMTFAKDKKVQVITVSEESNNEKENLPAGTKPPNSWIKSKSQTLFFQKHL